MHTTIFTGASALLFLALQVQAKHGHGQLDAIHRRHRLERELARQANETLEKRGGVCTFPTDAGLIPITPGSGNGGWAFAPDQFCTAGRYCPYACPSGQVSMQWDPSVSVYAYPGSRNGGLLCNPDGTVSKPFPNRPYCQPTTANIGVQNSCGKNVAFCQTVLPGDEDMLIPTDVSSWSKLAVPDPTYWASTAAHYYINPPGVSSSQGCVWGSTANPYGNWAPYVAGANADSSGQTFIKLGWNPIYLEHTTPFRNEMPTWGVRIECPNGGCNGLPCSIDPAKNKVNEMIGSSSSGAGGGAFCVVTVNKGSKANFVVFEAGSSNPSSSVSGSGSGSKWGNLNQGGQFYQSAPSTDTSTEASVKNSTSTASTSTTLSVTSASTTVSSSADGPTGQPHYQLFNTSVPSASTKQTSTSVQVTATKAAVAQHTGGASSIELSLTAIVLGLGAMLL